MIQYVVIFSLLLFSLGFSPVFAEVNTDKSVYYPGDAITISGSVVPEDGVTSMSLLVVSSSDIVSIAQLNIITDSWSHEIKTGGTVWIPNTTYTVKATYNGVLQQTTFLLEDQPTSPSNTQSSSSDDTNTSSNSSQDTTNVSDDSQQQTLFSFIDPTKDPQHYIDRYNNEQIYRDWFDANFPGYTIYDAVGLDVIPLPPPDIPPWIKNVFQFYSEGNIGDDELKQALVWLIQEGILKIE